MTIARPIAGAQRLELPYRIGVGIMLINSRGHVWTGRRLPKWAAKDAAHVWQMPQGGVLANEDPLDAAYRELEEETAVRSVELIAGLNRWLTYDLPPELLGMALKGRYRGQRQRWFAMRFYGDDSEIDIAGRAGRKAEFDRWKWRALDELPAIAVKFKRPVYEELARVFAPYARPE